jgi:ribA/ribD-fused uncharacterized protein
MINSFSGEYAFLSNFSYSEVDLGEFTFPTVEHAFQAAKTLDPIQRSNIALMHTADKAKRFGRQVQLRPDWEEIKISVMLFLLRQKFCWTDLQEKLLETGDLELEEGNTWNDTYWGVCNGVGKNMLGMLLMEVRSEIQMMSRIIHG